MAEPNRGRALRAKTRREVIKLMGITGYNDCVIRMKLQEEFPGFLIKHIREFNAFVEVERSGIYTSRDQFNETKTKLWDKKRLISRGLNLLISWKLPNKIDEEVMEQYNNNLSHYRMNVPKRKRWY
jgi:hypothetical protein